MAFSSLTPQKNPEFVRIGEQYKCIVCKQVARDAMATECGHRLCLPCIDPMFQEAKEPVKCPAQEDDCVPIFRTKIVPDPGGQREIKKLLVFCPNKQYGCSTTVPWRDLEKHMSECTFCPVECPNKSRGCSVVVARNELDNHQKKECNFRPVMCTYCKQEFSFMMIGNHEENECPDATTTCKFCGAGPMKRREIQGHLESCPRKPKECRFKVIGCTYMATEEEVSNHEINDGVHHMEILSIFVTNSGLNRLQLINQIQEIAAERDGLKRRLEQHKEELASLKSQVEALKTASKDAKMRMVSQTERIIQLERKSEDTVKRDVMERCEQQTRELQVTIRELREKLTLLERRPATGVGSSEAGVQVRPEELNDMKQQLTMHDRQFHNLDVRLAELDLRFQVLETASYDGILLWKIRDYTRRKQEAITGKTLSLYSQPFYSSRFGYKMCARVYLNGDGMGKNTHMSLFFVVMRGEYDALLPWPFQQKVTLMLLDQQSGQRHLSDTFKPDPASSSFKRPTTEMNIASGCPLFVSHSVLETPTYIKDDIIFIKLMLDLSNLPPPNPANQ
uniref:TRAF3 n=1 Tax=Sinanodonta woodiana TaxID=1069815 RepID=A0A291RBW5_SINWO|nr:TRAF3 [Sinanodonta woodiana]